MPKLKVLNLVQLHRSSLPSSLHLLKNLRTLCLDDSTINDVAIIGKLKKLKVLSLKHSFIKKLSKEIGELTELKLLDLSSCKQLQVIVPNVISELLQLEEFHIKGCPIQWKVDVLKELKLLSNISSVELDVRDNKLLRMLEVQFNSIKSLEELHGFKNVELLQLAEFSEDKNSVEDSKFDLQCNELMPLFNEKNLKVLDVWRVNGLVALTTPSVARSLVQLRELRISNCGMLVEIVENEGDATSSKIVFDNLKLLSLKVLESLTYFCSGNYSFNFSSLEELIIRKCPKMKTFSQGMLSTPKLYKVNYEEMEIENEGNDLKKIVYGLCKKKDEINSHLEVFEFQNGLAEITWQNKSKTLEISYDKSAYIPLGPIQRFHKLKKLQLNGCNYKEIKTLSDLLSLEVLDVSWCEMLLSPLLSTPSFQNLKVLAVEGCHGLVNLTTPSIARSLVQLRELRISNCEMMIEILENEGDAVWSSEQVVLNNLNKLSLEYLDGLLYFCSRNYSINFPSLEELIIEDCPNTKYFCQGMLSTPMLHKVNYERKEVENEDNDLNSTIQRAHKEKIVQSCGKDSPDIRLQSQMIVQGYGEKFPW
ncbi:putative disease resistance protein At4g19050 [Mangifera indica]|uniref:putative disease resistance protein At4g19050 n=1 Tax=Mangifera indica TaxID=29780 RepID=UPI001CFB35B2|nr:putative disease resistance protein At4g19050 [Mangifera indica]